MRKPTPLVGASHGGNLLLGESKLGDGLCAPPTSKRSQSKGLDMAVRQAHRKPQKVTRLPQKFPGTVVPLHILANEMYSVNISLHALRMLQARINKKLGPLSAHILVGNVAHQIGGKEPSGIAAFFKVLSYTDANISVAVQLKREGSRSQLSPACSTQCCSKHLRRCLASSRACNLQQSPHHLQVKRKK